jgi:hypothetical protein
MSTGLLATVTVHCSNAVFLSLFLFTAPAPYSCSLYLFTAQMQWFHSYCSCILFLCSVPIHCFCSLLLYCYSCSLFLFPIPVQCSCSLFLFPVPVYCTCSLLKCNDSGLIVPVYSSYAMSLFTGSVHFCSAVFLFTVPVPYSCSLYSFNAQMQWFRSYCSCILFLGSVSHLCSLQYCILTYSQGRNPKINFSLDLVSSLNLPI